jgi:hypothetical protein
LPIVWCLPVAVALVPHEEQHHHVFTGDLPGTVSGRFRGRVDFGCPLRSLALRVGMIVGSLCLELVDLPGDSVQALGRAPNPKIRLSGRGSIEAGILLPQVSKSLLDLLALW